MYGWGSGKFGETGTGESQDSCAPKECVDFRLNKYRHTSLNELQNFIEEEDMGTKEPDENIIAVHAGGKHSMILTDSGTLYSWGFGAIG
jgi:alpha-tubulin suppressor-like RCC1 family protein